MLVEIELFTQMAVSINYGDELSMKVNYNGKILEEGISRDSFEFSGTVLGGKRLAAIGRERRYTYGDLTGIFEADPGKGVNLLFIDPEDDIKLIIETNIWLDPGRMVQDLSLKVFSENRMRDIPLNRPDVKIDWPGRGKFIVDIGDFIRELNSERCKI
ncbi:MAG: hypothetical protein PWR06_878 [Thermoanaerobacteraceae bacterium]|jgi:hypothetical protein|uniref:Uncharacterized protein n=1 Tax=Biomaibacter acetigenes TaxID=2316383 RepID=A0A3G2R6Y5_9FIRM|nr:hypothetical protein [Biomaibacter acetigenes]AYO31181.1 hypothetical protein D2962_11740 [Biomaibacter acetigenes]MDK2878162.1 hypothetical protein [Thermoanaerobacteraceae bacterium]MDN5301716.1 hypothetical protein [Thermoanaerobacteraceae bacterium]MDN5311547.1 hypothetical protein [Thermoanaerobacteraceae bacterium]